MRRLLPSLFVSLPLLAGLPSLVLAAPTQVIWADVVEAHPVTRVVRKPVNERVCWQEEVYYEVPQRRSSTGTIVGAILGGVIGNQFGGGSGRDAMTVAGAALGGAIASDHQRRHHPQRMYAALEDRCGTNTEWTETRQTVGWDVVYEYQGETYVTRMPDNPGDRIQLEVSVQPVSP